MKLAKIFFMLTFSFLLSTVLAVGADLPLAPTAMVVMGAQIFLSFTMPVTGAAFYNFTNLEWSDGENNMGGLQVTGYYAPIADFDNIPTLYENPTTAAEEVTLDSSVTDFTFLTGKNFFELYMTMETSEVVDEAQGEIDGQSFINKASLVYPGTKVEALAFAKNVNNAKMLFVFIEANGQRRVIGSEGFPAYCKVGVTTGKKTADRKGLTIEIFSYFHAPAAVHDGEIPLTPPAV